MLETVLAVIVCLYSLLNWDNQMVDESFSVDGGFVNDNLVGAAVLMHVMANTARGAVILTSVFAAKVGLDHSLGRSNPQGMASAGGIERVARDRLYESLERDGVDLVDFHEIVTTSVVILLFTSWLLLWSLLWRLVTFVCRYVFFGFFSATFSFGPSGGSGSVAVWLVSFILVQLAFNRLLERFGFFEKKFRKLDQACRSQPSCKLVRAALVLSSTGYGVVLHLSPAPSVLQWSLIVTHTARALKLLVSLRDQSEGIGAAPDPRDIFRKTCTVLLQV